RSPPGEPGSLAGTIASHPRVRTGGHELRGPTGVGAVPEAHGCNLAGSHRPSDRGLQMVRSLLVALVAGALAIDASAQAPIRIDLNIPALKLEVWEGGEKLATYPIAVGMPGFD